MIKANPKTFHTTTMISLTFILSPIAIITFTMAFFLHFILLKLSNRIWISIFTVPFQQLAVLYIALVSIVKNKNESIQWKGRTIKVD